MSSYIDGLFGLIILEYQQRNLQRLVLLRDSAAMYKLSLRQLTPLQRQGDLAICTPQSFSGFGICTGPLLSGPTGRINVLTALNLWH